MCVIKTNNQQDRKYCKKDPYHTLHKLYYLPKYGSEAEMRGIGDYNGDNYKMCSICDYDHFY